MASSGPFHDIRDESGAPGASRFGVAFQVGSRPFFCSVSRIVRSKIVLEEPVLVRWVCFMALSPTPEFPFLFGDAGRPFFEFRPVVARAGNDCLGQRPQAFFEYAAQGAEQAQFLLSRLDSDSNSCIDSS